QDIDRQYGASVFTNLQLTNPVAVKEMIKELDKLKLSSIDTDIKGDAFEYFLQQATATNNDLGEYFTPRHITKTIVNLVNPKYGEKIYDPFCGTVGFLTEAFDHIKDNTLIANNSSEEIKLKHNTIFGREITSNAKLAKMNMILHG
ncbi:N-6 DNA methylase, partial [Acinetobacter baumannii]